MTAVGAKLGRGLVGGLLGLLALGLGGCFFNLSESPDFKRWYFGEPGLAGAMGQAGCDTYADKITGARHATYLHFRLPEVLLQPQGGGVYPERSTARRLAGGGAAEAFACEMIPPGEETFAFDAVDAGLVDTLVPYRRLRAAGAETGRGGRVGAYVKGLVYNTGIAAMMKAPLYLVHDVVKTLYIPVAGAYYAFRDDPAEAAPAAAAAVAQAPAAPPAAPVPAPAAPPAAVGAAAGPAPESRAPASAVGAAPDTPATEVAPKPAAVAAAPPATSTAPGPVVVDATPRQAVAAPAAAPPPSAPTAAPPAATAVPPPRVAAVAPLPEPRPASRRELRLMAAVAAFQALTPGLPPALQALFQERLEAQLGRECRRVALVGPAAANYPAVLDQVPRDLFGRLDSRTLTAMARQLGFNVYVTGSILDAGVRNEARGVFWYRDTEGRLRVSVLAEVFDAASGTMVLNRTFVEDLEVDELAPGAGGSLRNTDLPAARKALSLIAEKMGEAVCEALAELPWRAFVLAVDGDRLTLSAGSAGGLQPGHVLNVYSSQTLQGMNDQPYYLAGPRVGRIQVVSVESRRSVAQVLEGSGFAPDQLAAADAR